MNAQLKADKAGADAPVVKAIDAELLNLSSKYVGGLKRLDSAIKTLGTDMTNIEEIIIKEYELKNPGKFNKIILPLVHALEIEKQEDEKSTIFETRLFSEINKVLNLDLK